MSSAFASGWSIVAWVGLLVAIAQITIAHRAAHLTPTGAIGWGWRALAALGFAVTWTFMIRMATGDIARYPSLGAWSRDSNLFFDAYRRVTGTAPAWWWSQQLMAWALAGALWFAVEGRRRALRFWAYLWLAMCVAVSVALPLFAQRLRAEKVVDRGAGVPLSVAAGIVAATLALVATPFVAGPLFVAAMLVLHGGLLVPAVLAQRSPRAPRAIDLRTAAWGVAFACLALHVGATFRLHATPLSALASVVVHDPAQASISSDVVLTWLACALFVATSRGRSRAIAFLVLAPLISLGAAFAWAALLGGPTVSDAEPASSSGGADALASKVP